MNDSYEICVLCGEVVDIEADMPIELRVYYVNGIGQLCKRCYEYSYDKDKTDGN